MDKMEWAVESLEYLRKARIAIDDEFRGAMQDAKGYPGSWKDPWHGTSRDIISNLYHYSEEFVADVRIPNEMFASPERFEQGLVAYRAFVQAMVDDLDEGAGRLRTQAQDRRRTTHRRRRPPAGFPRSRSH